jgi:hypothetical protein
MNELTLDSNPMYVNNVERHTIPPVTFETWKNSPSWETLRMQAMLKSL